MREGVGIRGSRVGPRGGVGWGPLASGAGLARFVPVGTGRPRPAEWAGAGQRFSSLQGPLWAVRIAPSHRRAAVGRGEGGRQPVKGPGKGAARPGHPSQPTREWKEQKAGSSHS